MMPTSVRMTLENVTDQYFIAFSDYLDGHWEIVGPCNDSATIEIPNLAETSAADIYTSGRGWHYFAIIIPAGGGMTISGVELGVHGGQNSLSPPSSLIGEGGENGFFLRWYHSVDFISPDFAGYILERAPLLHGDFSSLTPGLITADSFFDETAMLATSYRYRIATVDTSDNLSLWETFIGGPNSGVLAMPVVVVDLPRGHFYGPAEVTFDLSGSYDPEGAAVYEEVVASWHRLPAHYRRRVHLVTLPMNDLQENAAMVNALQRHAAIVVQKSLREGFGLTVTEAMWKGTPVVASDVGGIPTQIENGKTGFLVKPGEPTECAARVVELLTDHDLAEEIGPAAREHVRRNFLITSHLLNYLQLFSRS
jgi:hypothetical protein